MLKLLPLFSFFLMVVCVAWPQDHSQPSSDIVVARVQPAVFKVVTFAHITIENRAVKPQLSGRSMAKCKAGERVEGVKCYCFDPFSPSPPRNDPSCVETVLKAEYKRDYDAGIVPFRQSQGQYYWRKIADAPGKYLVIVDQVFTQETSLEPFLSKYDGPVATGTAFAVSREGVFLTNAHVIAPPGKEILADPGDAAALFGERLLRYLTDDFGAIPDELRPQVMISLARFATPSCVVFSKITGIGVSTWAAPAGTHIERASILQVGNPGTIEDLAVLKVRGLAEHVIVLPLGDSDKYRNPIHALGFPAIAEFLGVKDDPNNIIKHDGEIHSVSVNTNGRDETWFHMTAEINHGDSGGPVVDATGRVVGINCRGLDAPGEKLAIPINVARKFLDNAGVSPDLGPLTQHWLSGWDAFAQQRYSVARQEFLEVARDDLSQRRSYARDAIAECDRHMRQR